MEITAASGTQKEVRLAVDWEPYEISLVPIGADSGAAVSSTRSLEPIPVGGNRIMDQAAVATLEQATRAAKAAKMPNAEVLARSWVNAGLTIGQTQDLAIDHVAERTGDDGARPNIISMGDDLETRGRHDAMVTAVMHRIAPSKVELTDHARQYRALTLFALARECAGPAAEVSTTGAGSWTLRYSGAGLA